MMMMRSDMNLSDPNKHLIFRLNDNGEGPELVRNVFLERGWREFDEDEHKDYDWNLWWKTTRFRTSDHEKLMAWQRINHYPKSIAITKKDCLARNMKRMAAVYGSNIFNFSPHSYILPNDYTRFVADFTNWQNKNPNQQQYWICKPADMSRGRGIFLFKDLSDLWYDFNAVIQKYCVNPLLISGYKFDLRVYVCVTSFYPLNIYICQEGLARFGTEKFDLSSIDNVFSHLTNTSINKFSPSYSSDKERIGPGCKWTLTQLRHYLHQAHIDDAEVWSRIKSLIIMTILLQVPQVSNVPNCFELYGFDILIDEKLKPWLLEVNFSPSFSYDCKADADVKKGLVHDIIDLLKFQNSDCERGGAEYHRHQENIAKTKPGYRPIPSLSRNSPTRRKSTASFRTPRKTKSSSKLPRINLSESMNSSSSGSNLMEDGDDDDESLPMSLTPGCGLPSVQHASCHSNSNSSSSGSHSSLSFYSNRLSVSRGSLTSRSFQNEPIMEVSVPRSPREPNLNKPMSRKSTRRKENVVKPDSPEHTSVTKSPKLTQSVPQALTILPAKRFTDITKRSSLLSKKSNNRLRPWRQVSKKSTTLCTGSETVGPVKQSGSFFLVFPFNDATTKMTKLSTFDLRGAIKETQRDLKQRIVNIKKHKADPASVSHLLWPPLIAVS